MHKMFRNVIEIAISDVPNGNRLEVSGLATNSKGEIFVCDRRNSWVFCFASDGSYLRQIGRRNQRSGDIVFPTALTIDSKDNLYILCSEEVLVYNSRYKRVMQFEIDFHAHSISVDSLGNVYLVGYRQNSIVHKYSPKGDLLESFGVPFQHDALRVKEYYSGGKLCITGDRLYLNHRTPYQITVFDLHGNILAQIQRSEYKFQPRFKISENRQTFYRSSSGLSICFSNELILNSFYLLNEGIYLDIYDEDYNRVYQDIPLNAYLLGSDHQGNIYYMTRITRGNSIFRGRLIDLQGEFSNRINFSNTFVKKSSIR